MRPILTICIPSYNRPEQIGELLNSIDCDPKDIEIEICEDKSPKREQIREVVQRFKEKSPYRVNYHENEKNLGFDGNLRHLVSVSTGIFIMYMGDDDLFIPNALDKYIAFLKNNQDKKYVLRAYKVIHPDGSTENFKYLPETTSMSAGVNTVAWLFKRSVTICGFTIARDEAESVATREIDGTLLYQVYLMAEVCLKSPSVYCDIPIVQAIQSFRLDKPNFGAAESEKDRYTPGKITPDNSVNFSKAYFELTDYLERKHGIQLTNLVRKDISKYSYPFLSIQRKRGASEFLKYAKRLERELGFGCTPYFYIYKYSLLLLGESTCDRGIVLIKKLVGHTPNF